MSDSNLADSLKLYEDQRSAHEPEFIAGTISLEEYRALTQPLWDDHVARMAGIAPKRKAKRATSKTSAEDPDVGAVEDAVEDGTIPDE